jgi:hypothetical protein
MAAPEGVLNGAGGGGELKAAKGQKHVQSGCRGVSRPKGTGTALSSPLRSDRAPAGLGPTGFHRLTRKAKNQHPRGRGRWCLPPANVRSHTTPPFASVPALRTGFKGQRVASGKLSLGEWGSSAFVCSSSGADPHSPSFASPPVPVDLQEPGARLAATGEGGSVCDRTQATAVRLADQEGRGDQVVPRVFLLSLTRRAGSGSPCTIGNVSRKQCYIKRLCLPV